MDMNLAIDDPRCAPPVFADLEVVGICCSYKQTYISRPTNTHQTLLKRIRVSSQAINNSALNRRFGSVHL
eukprot:1420668-Amphidinium_carterae.1